MQQSRAQNEDSMLEEERRLKYKGTARISLDVLFFRQDQPREYSQRQADFLMDCFQKEGCHRVPLCNHVPAIIDHESLDAALQRLGGTADDLLTNDEDPNYPLLEFPTGFHLECLHGWHRIEAGREFLHPGDHWWTVDLYLSDLNVDLKTCLVEEYSNEEKPSDGEIYYKMRRYHFQRNFNFEMRWKARLRGKRKGYLLTLTRNETLTAAFDDLLDIPGLWGGMKISTLHTVMALKCDTELLHYLRRIKQVWSDLVRDNKAAMGKIDQATVKALEMKAPRASTADAEFLRIRVRGGELFSAFDDCERDDIWSRLTCIDGLIPSLATFFKDIRYLERLANCVKQLTGDNVQISHAFKQLFSPVDQEDGRVRIMDGQTKIQVAENAFVYGQGTRRDQVDLGYRQIIAYAMRHFADMPREPVKECRVMQPAAMADRTVLRHFADLADQLGFTSTRIKHLQQYPAALAEQTPPSKHPPLVTSGSGVGIAHRCGTPHRLQFNEDQKFWFINHLHDESDQQGKGITNFFIRKQVYLAFFGWPTWRPTAEGSSHGRSPSLPPAPDFRDLPHGPSPDGQQHTVGTRTDRSPSALEPAEDDGGLFVPEAGPSQPQAEGMGDGGHPEQPTNSPTPAEQERWKRKLLEHKKQREAWLEKQRLERERLERERLERERLERERLEKERLERERLERLERERLEREIDINLIRWEDGTWKYLTPLAVDPENPSNIERLVNDYMTRGIRAFNTYMRMMSPEECFQVVVNNRTHTILLIAEDELAIDKMHESAVKLHTDATKRVIGLKRKATEDLSHTYHARKMVVCTDGNELP
ncbi:hypothetical protein GMDG_08373 [Pseudogymnoascus destructans 20631-21]|uniref:Uncharacterized protein n=1 Tax=Pseudogymnoascus destructans (strain ATCC MYA-4855 / 20631-21) TaxID=658429 RepID=L8G3W2_PSED2|nr:hypothetical protein GMDG_08373 [Pseudogymnoascus destructans 20631-21]